MRIIPGKAVLLLAALALFAACSVMTALGAGDPVAQADELYSQRYDHANVQKAIDILEAALADNPGDYDILWRLAQDCWYLGDRAEGSDRVAWFERGRGYGEQAVKANDLGVDGHYWFAANIGSVGREKGILKSLFMVPDMRREIDRCIGIDPSYADAHYVMAQLLWEIPGIAGGDKNRALQEAKIATELVPTSVDYWVLYGKYASGRKDYQTARMALEKALALPDDPQDPSASEEKKAEARAELEKIQGK